MRLRVHYSDAQKARMWDRWEKGGSLQQIAQLFDCNHSSTQRILAESGRIRPPRRRRSRRVLSLVEREEISRAVVAGQSTQTTAAKLGRAPSTVSRELCRNGGRGAYRASHAEAAAWERARRPKPCNLALHPVLVRLVAIRLQRQWSPEQIAGWLRRTYPDNTDRQVSHETIYRTLYIQSRGALKKELLAQLRRTRAMRRSRHHAQKTGTHGRIVVASLSDGGCR